MAQGYLKAENLHITFLANSWSHLSGLAGALYKAMRFPIVDSGLCLALCKAGPHLLPSSSMEGTRCITLENNLLKVRKGSD